jgi:hypothetical protein|tara:strand:+ start:244 stop:486 length:243 start_codon:yes stop_codon:yes gene_type:complete
MSDPVVVERKEFMVADKELCEFLKAHVDSATDESGTGWDYVEIVDPDADVRVTFRPEEDGKVSVVFDGKLVEMWVGESEK